MNDLVHFKMQHQEQTNWSWAAVSASVALYYAAGSGWTQCAVADRVLGRSDCCGSGAGGPCNVYSDLEGALKVVGHYTGRQAGLADLGTIMTETDAGRPVGLRVAWNGGGTDFIIATGTVAVPFVGVVMMVADPIFGNGTVVNEQKYRGSGTWTDSYFTAAQPSVEGR